MTQQNPIITLRGVSKTYGDIRAVKSVSLTIEKGSFTALVGSSGSGKSTLLKMLNRLIEPDEGAVTIDGNSIQETHPATLRRDIGYVFQGVGLFPHMTVAENIAIGPRLSGTPLPESQIDELLHLVALDQSYKDRFPDALSGGQRQRIGVARALANTPQVLLMDEPFGALDPITRDELGNRIKELHQQLGLTTIMVTHDMAEALLIVDRVIVMDRGVIAADNTPRQLVQGQGGVIAQNLVAVPREQSNAMIALAQ